MSGDGRGTAHLWAEIDEACLVGMEREPKSCKTLAQDRQHAFGVDDIVERYDRIVGEPGKRAFPFEARPQPSPGSAISLRASAWRRLPALQPPAPRFSPGGLRLLLVRLLR